MDKLIKELYDENSTNFFDEMYISSENEGRILTEKFKKKLDVINKEKEYSKEKLNDKLKVASVDNKDYTDNIEKENVLYIMQYYRQRNERYYKIVC